MQAVKRITNGPGVLTQTRTYRRYTVSKNAVANNILYEIAMAMSRLIHLIVSTFTRCELLLSFY